MRFFFFRCYGAHRDLHSFPTRRSSDLERSEVRDAQTLLSPVADDPSLGVGRVDVRLGAVVRSEEHTSELQSHSDLVCRLLLEKKKKMKRHLFDGSLVSLWRLDRGAMQW